MAWSSTQHSLTDAGRYWLTQDCGTARHNADLDNAVLNIVTATPGLNTTEVPEKVIYPETKVRKI